MVINLTSLKSETIIAYLKGSVLMFSFLKIIWLLCEAIKICGNIKICINSNPHFWSTSLSPTCVNFHGHTAHMHINNTHTYNTHMHTHTHKLYTGTHIHPHTPIYKYAHLHIHKLIHKFFKGHVGIYYSRRFLKFVYI